MQLTKYTYNISTFPNQKVDANKLTVQIQQSNITIALDHIDLNTSICDIWFKDELTLLDSTSTLPIIISSHDGEHLPEVRFPTMEDGRMIVRTDSRPLNFQTYYTMSGDDSTAGIGHGTEIIWDFSNDSGIVTGEHVPSGMKCKEFLIKFLCPVHTKDGCLYFFDAPWGCYLEMDIVVPPNHYYPNEYGSIPAAALGLIGNQMYSFSDSEYILFSKYVNKHRMCGSCPMGDEINAEGSSVDAVPPGWFIRGRVYTPENDIISKGFAELELYRCHSIILPGMTIQDLINLHM